MKLSKKLAALALVMILALSVFVFAACDKGVNEEGGAKYGAYILSDKATFLSYKKNAEGDKLPNLSLSCTRTTTT